MADYNSSLPIRTENDGDAVVKVADATIPSQQLAVEADGSINVNASFAPGTEVTITDGTDTVEVNADGSLNVIATATDLDIRDLSASQDNVAISDGTDTLAVNADGSLNITDNGGSITVDGSVTVSATDLDIRDLDSAQDSVEVLQATHDNLNTNANLQVGDADVANGNPVPISDAGGSLTVDATDLDIRDLTHVSDSVKIGDGTDFLAVNTDGSINVVVSDDIPGTEISSYQTTASVAAGASTNHDYTVTALMTFTGHEVVASGSGRMKVEVLFNGVTKFVAFNSTANPTVIIPILKLVKAVAGQVIRITLTNNDNQPQNLYSTLLGIETA